MKDDCLASLECTTAAMQAIVAAYLTPGHQKRKDGQFFSFTFDHNIYINEKSRKM